MLKDNLLYFDSGLALTATGASTNIIDTLMNAAGGGIVNHFTALKGNQLNPNLFLIVRIGTAFNNCTSIDFQLQTAAASSFASPIVLYDSSAILLASLTANTILLQVPLPEGSLEFLRMYYTVVGTAPSAGTIDAFLTFDTKFIFGINT